MADVTSTVVVSVAPIGTGLTDSPSAITPPVPSLPLPLDHDEYQKYRQSTTAAYTASVNEYDRLVTWASAGALAVSMSFLEKFGNKADPRTAWLLGLSWGLLAGSFGMSLWSQYFSSRAHSWTLRKLDHQQIAAAERRPDWAAQATRLKTIGHRYGIATRWLTFFSGMALVGGIVTITTFAYLNAPFRDANSQTTTVVPDGKRGLDVLPPPVPRPATPNPAPAPSPTPVADPAPKR